jgi:hypothetical protein
MFITKNKTVYPVTIDDVKKHSRIDADNFDDDAYIENIIKASTEYCENFIDKDIALTSNTLLEYDFIGSELRIDEGNLISISNIITDSSSLITSYTYEIYNSNSHFKIDFDNYTIDSDPLTIQFTTGFEEGFCPWPIRHAVKIGVDDLYWTERGSYVLPTIKRTDVIQRLLMPYKAIRW